MNRHRRGRGPGRGDSGVTRTRKPRPRNLKYNDSDDYDYSESDHDNLAAGRPGRQSPPTVAMSRRARRPSNNIRVTSRESLAGPP